MKLIEKLTLVAAGLAVSSSAWSIPMSTVGAVDTLMAQTTLSNSGSGTESGWIETVLETSISDYTQTQVSANDWQKVDDAPLGTFAFALDSPLDFYLVKIGNNSGASNTHFLFQNIGGLDWAVVNLATMGFNTKNILNIGKFSHIGSGSSSVTSVPEPASLGMLGMGLIGLAVGSRRRKRAS